jgi:hypothetical protein
MMLGQHEFIQEFSLESWLGLAQQWLRFINPTVHASFIAAFRKSLDRVAQTTRIRNYYRRETEKSKNQKKQSMQKLKRTPTSNIKQQMNVRPDSERSQVWSIAPSSSTLALSDIQIEIDSLVSHNRQGRTTAVILKDMACVSVMKFQMGKSPLPATMAEMHFIGCLPYLRR